MDSIRAFLATGLLIAAFAAGAHGQQVDALADDRLSALEIVDERPPAPAVNTALAFTNTWGRPVKVRLEAFNHEGEAVGRAEIEVPARGLKYFWVSRLVQENDDRFVGWVAARTSLPVAASAILLGIGTTDLPVERLPSLNSDVSARRRYSVLFPLTAAF